MDVLVLAMLKNNSSMSGYDVIAHIHKKFGILVSPGTVYSLLYSLERDGLIRGVWNQRKRVYALTEKGEQAIETIQNANDRIHVFLKNVFGKQDG
jgi:DNA-binding PadR family transcriptional regulator